MSGRISGFLFLGVCVILAILLILGVTDPIISGSIFAVALVVLGGSGNNRTRTLVHSIDRNPGPDGYGEYGASWYSRQRRSPPIKQPAVHDLIEILK